MLISIILLVIFLAAMLAIGIWGMRRTKTLSDFFLGGRTVGPWVSAIAYGTTYFSAVLFIGFAGKLGWGFGLPVLWIAAGNVLFGSLAAWLVLGRRTRRMSQNLEALTMPEFLAARYQAGWLKVIAALIVFIFLLPYSASIFQGLSYLFQANFNISYDLALLIMIGITGLYLVLGGYFAVTLTDFVQGIIMFFGCLALLAIITGKAGGLAGSVASVLERYPVHVPPAKQPPWYLLASLVFMTSFGTWGLPQMVQKYYAVKDERVIRFAAVITTVFALVIVFTAYFNGALAHVFFDAPVLNDAGKPDFDRIIPTLLVKTMPSWLMAVILLLVLSASMSTLSSLVMVSASAIAIDLAGVRARKLTLIRLLSGVFIVVSYLIARYRIEVIVTLMSLSWGCVAGSFMAPFLYGLYWKRATLAGAVAGLVVGLGLAITLFFVLGPANSPIASTIAMIVPFAVVPLASSFTRPPEAKTLKRAFAKV
jgi:SSS family solute:Na+ symporter